jgi:chromate transporter
LEPAEHNWTALSFRARLHEVVWLFLKLGVTAFGGPAAHIAMMHDEVVKRRKWVSAQQFLDLLGATNLIPGPNSTEMAIHLSFVRAGWIGLVVGGACFILPAMLIVMGLAWLYVEYGALPAANWLLYGVKPVIMAIVAQALWSLGQKAVKNLSTALVGLGALVLYFLGFNEIWLMFAGGLILWLITLRPRPNRLAALGWVAPLAGLSASTLAPTPFSLSLLFFTFLKIGAVLYGSGYVLLAFLRNDFVLRLGWLTDQQLLDAITVGQVTPGPVFTTATFVGYILGETPGALLATLGIFLPSFLYVAISNPLIPRIRQSSWVSSALDGVNVAALGLMAAVTWQLGRASLVDPLTVGLAVGSLALLLRFAINSSWLVLAGALVGLLRALVA